MGPRFFYDFNSPYAYLAATRIETVLAGADVSWQPIALAFVLRSRGRTPWSLSSMAEREAGMRDCESRAAAYGLPPLVWPPGWPRESYTLDSLRAALVAEQDGALREFSQAAFGHNFVEGAGLDDAGIAAAARAAGLDGDDVLRRARTDAIKAELRARTEAAISLGVGGVPTVVTPSGAVVWGDDRLEEAVLG